MSARRAIGKVCMEPLCFMDLPQVNNIDEDNDLPGLSKKDSLSEADKITIYIVAVLILFIFIFAFSYFLYNKLKRSNMIRALQQLELNNIEMTMIEDGENLVDETSASTVPFQISPDLAFDQT